MAKGNANGAGRVAPPPPRDWLTQLNDLLSAASRRLFQSQLVLRAASERDIRAQLPELRAFATLLCENAATHGHAIRQAFRDPQAQWLGRGAVESGASGFFCHLLLRETAASQDTDASWLVVQVLLDPVLQNCYERAVETGLTNTHRACEWRGERPKYYAMPCANLWETLLPFLARAARQHAAVFGVVLNDRIQTRPSNGSVRVNCRLAHVAGFWRLLDAVGDAKSVETMPSVVALLPKILAFAVRWSVLCTEPQGEALVSDMLRDPHTVFYDLLFEKFFHDLHEFLFKNAHATRVTRVALTNILERHLSTRPTMKTVERVRFAAFAVAACLLVKGLAHDAWSLIKNQRSVMFSKESDGRFLLVVGLVSHVEPTDADSVLCVLHELLDRYDAVSISQTKRRRFLLWVIYIIVCRQRLLDASANGESASFISLQKRILSIEIQDLQLMPLHWMEVLWRVCFGMPKEDVSTFIEEARAFRLASIKLNPDDAPLAWEELIHNVPLRHLDQFPSIMTILGAPYSSSLKLTKLSPTQLSEDVTEKVVHQISKKRRRLQKRDVVVLSEEHEESRQNALLLPEVMERTSSFMSAKRLCRLSLVCRAFARVTHSERLWKPLYFKLVQPLKIKCRHGSAYEHDWRLMYQSNYIAVKKMQNRHHAAARKAQRGEDMAFCWYVDDRELRMSVSINSAQLCQECGCNQLLGTNDAAKNHRVLHQKYRCPKLECREGLTSASALKQHMKTYHKSTKAESDQGEMEQKSKTDKPLFHCTASECDRSFKSQKWLQNHITRAHSDEAQET